MPGQENKDKFDKAKARMLKQDLKGRGITNELVLKAMAEVPREEFVPESYFSQAYADGPLPIGMGQTISQPYIVALMTQELWIEPDCEVLEIGTGSGYQTAILAELSVKVYTIERVRPLMEKARGLLDELGYSNVLFSAFDGTLGWKEYEPYDAIMVTAGAPKVPEPLYQQLAEGGRMIIPIGDKFSQELIKIVRRRDQFRQKNLGGCRFVDLIGIHGWKD